ncbi:cell wall-binding repeat-containing protein [Planococcus shenhongbingii]|uniref:Cell wall-binding repeat-containing protein n=1 Tax=Planococcus shenhongbingii TaxID=3058398 RepID=A0ABT8NA09_9BACL|nr:cell wall-binding repeat-containing protein [Planococcus sp. N017]MDN7244720.1 cell wall-binding repeat-containing protein [Planococcus sp. N017]
MKKFKSLRVLALTITISASAFVLTPEASTVFNDFERISGKDRYHTAVAVSQEGWADNSTDHVVLAVGSNYPDALAGAPLAQKLNSPILLVKKDVIPSAVLAEIKRIGAENATILGGKGVISDLVMAQLEEAGITPTRISGANRHQTSALIAQKVGGAKAVVVSSSGFADSLAIASYAAEKGMPILLTSPAKMSPEVEQMVEKYSEVIVVGGTEAVSPAVVEQIEKSASTRRIAGQDRFSTAAAVVSELYPSTVSASLMASGEHFADALTGSALGAKQKKPIFLTRKDSLPAVTKNAITAKSVSALTVIGGEGAISNGALNPAPAQVTTPAIAPVTASVSTPVIRTGIVEESQKYMGVPYLYGGTTTRGFDCSGYLQYVFAKQNITIPRTTALMAKSGKEVSYANAEPGDIIILDLKNAVPTTPSHAGIYLGDGKIIHAGFSTGVTIMSLNAKWANWDKKIVTVRSYVN